MFPVLSTAITPTTSWNGSVNVTTTTTLTPLDLNATTIYGNVSEDAGNETNMLHMCHPENPEFNCSVEDFLHFYLGAKQMPLETAIWVSLML